MSLRRACLVLVLTAACGDEPAGAPCGEEGLQLLESPGTTQEQRYNLVLESLQEQLHAAVGKYLDGSRPSYRGVVRVVQETNSSTYGHRRTEAGGLAYGVLIDEFQPINVPQDGMSVPVHKLVFYLPTDRFRDGLGQDVRAPDSAFHGSGSLVSFCQGSATSFEGSPEKIVLTGIVCDREDDYGSVHFEIDGAFAKLGPGDIDYTVLRQLREIGDRGYFPVLDQKEVPETGVLLEAVEEGRFTYNLEGPCYDEIDYSSVSYLHTQCIGTHGVAELEVGEARRCCCEGHCHPGEYVCTPI